MPHYANGSPASIGDLALSTPKYPGNTSVLGIVTAIMPGSETCNGNLLAVAQKLSNGQWIPISSPHVWSITLSETVSADVPVNELIPV